MQCPSCSTDNAASSAFCRECGAALSQAGSGGAVARCRHCSTENLESASFCRGCGAALTPAAAAPADRDPGLSRWRSPRLLGAAAVAVVLVGVVALAAVLLAGDGDEGDIAVGPAEGRGVIRRGRRDGRD